MKNLIVANWKMNPLTQKDAKKLFGDIKKGLKGNNAKVIICPPFVYLPLLKDATLGAQNMFWEEKGAFNGEISGAMLRDLGVEYVIVGHSERRKYFGETDEIINKKIKLAVFLQLKTILCIGETQEEMDLGKTSEVLEGQITEALKNVSPDSARDIIIAYEPVWAIGTGQNCSEEIAKSSVQFIRSVVGKLYSQEIAEVLYILYGGSVNSQNSASYIKHAGVNGLLVGGASLNAKEFVEIVKSA